MRFSKGQKIVCIKRTQWKCIETGQPTPGPKFNEICTCTGYEDGNYISLKGFKLDDYSDTHFEPLPDLSKDVIKALKKPIKKPIKSTAEQQSFLIFHDFLGRSVMHPGFLEGIFDCSSNKIIEWNGIMRDPENFHFAHQWLDGCLKKETELRLSGYPFGQMIDPEAQELKLQYIHYRKTRSTKHAIRESKEKKPRKRNHVESDRDFIEAILKLFLKYLHR